MESYTPEDPTKFKPAFQEKPERKALSVGTVGLDSFWRVSKAVFDKLGNRGIKEGAKVPQQELKTYLEPEDLKEKITEGVGGNAGNMAASFAEQLPTELYTFLGNDEKKSQILDSLDQHGVKVIGSLNEPVINSSSIILVPENGGNRIIGSEHPEAHEEQHFNYEGKEPAVMILSTVQEPWKDVYREVGEYAKSHDTSLATSPGSVQFRSLKKALGENPSENVLEEVKELYHTIEASKILLVNKEEGEQLLQGAKKHVPETVEELMLALKGLGPEIISLTDGENGSYAVDGHDGIYRLRPFEVETVVDTTGAGDSFTGGFLGKHFTDPDGYDDIPECMKYGAVNAASVVEHIGAQTGILSKRAIEEKLTLHPDYQVEILREPHLPTLSQ